MPITKRWVFGNECTDEQWSKIDEILSIRKWSSLNRATSFLEIAEDETGLVGFICCQLHPMIGPQFVRPSARGTGIAQIMADDMIAKLQEFDARGWIVIADSAHTEKKCREIGMTEVQTPVFITQ